MAATDGWSPEEQWLFNDLLGPGVDDPGAFDAHLADLFDKAMFDMDISSGEREQAYQDMVDYFWDQYGLDFEDVFDWEDYREWYDSQ